MIPPEIYIVGGAVLLLLVLIGGWSMWMFRNGQKSTSGDVAASQVEDNLTSAEIGDNVRKMTRKQLEAKAKKRWRIEERK